MLRSALRLSLLITSAAALVVGALIAGSRPGISYARPGPSQPHGSESSGAADRVPASGLDDSPPSAAPELVAKPKASGPPGAPQNFLVRSQYLGQGPQAIQHALDYRLAEYTQIRPVSFFGQGVLLHQALHAPLHCVEQHIKRTCKDKYQPKALSGWRPYNTYKEAKDWHYQEYSNHIFGLALDIDPDLNPCCGCVNDWAKSERCKNGAKDMGPGRAPLGRHELPQCWIDGFKQHGFHWLGDDKGLRDTMHFEFLAEPGSVSCDEPKR